MVVAFALLATLAGWSGGGSAGASSTISYSGRGLAARVTVSGQSTLLADTGTLASAGSLDASSLSGVVPGSLAGDTLHAATIAQGDRTRSEASIGSIGLTAGLNTISADLAMSRTAAIKQGPGVDLRGRTHVDTLVVNGLLVVVTGEPNQIVPLVDGELVVNQQTTSTGGTIKSISVTALHVTVADVDIVLGMSSAGVSTGSTNCSGQQDFATGGGWAGASGNLKRSLGFIGGLRQNGAVVGHLVFINHVTDERVKGVVTAYAPGQQGNIRTMSGTAEFGGREGTFVLTVTDGGDSVATDSFQIEYASAAGGGGDSGTLIGGNIQVHGLCR